MQDTSEGWVVWNIQPQSLRMFEILKASDSFQDGRQFLGQRDRYRQGVNGDYSLPDHGLENIPDEQDIRHPRHPAPKAVVAHHCGHIQSYTKD